MLILVEPYWNLNKKHYEKIKDILFILVEPYWNLNEVHATLSASGSSNISRTILEFKSGKVRLSYAHLFILVEPYWNLNMQ